MNISKKIAAILLIFSLFCLSGYGQNKFRKGYIITLQQDTIYGLIDYKIASKSAEKCEFKTNASDKTISYTPDQIQGYRFTPGKYYEAIRVEANGVNKEVFLEYLVDGVADILFFRDEDGDHYFVKKDGEKMLPLTIDIIEVEKDGNTYIRRKEKYKQVLKYAFYDAPELSSKIDKIELNHYDLIDIAEDYHNKVSKQNEDIEYTREKSPAQIRFGLLAGADISRISFEYAEYLKRYIQSPFASSQSAVFGGFVNITAPFASERFSVQPEIWYGKREFYTEHLTLSHSYVKTPLTLRYTSISNRLRPTIAIGFASTFFMGTEADQTISGEAIDWLQSGRIQNGLETAFGFTYVLTNKKRIYLEARYGLVYGNQANRYVDYSSFYRITTDYFKSKTTSFGILTGFSF